MTICSVPFCSKNKVKGIASFLLPKQEEIREQWLIFLQRFRKLPQNIDNIRICEKHFNPNDVLKGVLRKILKPAAIPYENEDLVRAL